MDTRNEKGGAHLFITGVILLITCVEVVVISSHLQELDDANRDLRARVSEIESMEKRIGRVEAQTMRLMLDNIQTRRITSD